MIPASVQLLAAVLAVQAAGTSPPAATSPGGTIVLIWKNPSRDLDFKYGHGEYSRAKGASNYRTAESSQPITVEVPVPVGRGKVWYGFFDPRRPEIYSTAIRDYDCVAGGRVRVEITASKHSEPAPYSDQQYVDYDDVVWQEGCRFPEVTTAFTLPAIATISVRWQRPQPGVRLSVVYSRGRGRSLDFDTPSVENVPMDSGKAEFWVDVADQKGEVWRVQGYGYQCADGGHLDVLIDASLVNDRPQARVRFSGRDCKAAGLLERPCVSGRRKRGKTRGVLGCYAPGGRTTCCEDAPRRPGSGE